MANIEVKLRRGTTSQHSSFTGAEGEVTVDTDLDTLRVHDGSTAGGVRLAKHSELSAGGGGTVTSVGSGTGLTGGPITSSGTLSIANDGVDTAQIAADAVTATEISSTDTAFNINSSGEVGIAKTADTGYKLDVLGTIRTTDGNLFIAGDEAAFGIGNGPGIRIIYDDGAGTVETRDIFVKANGDLDFNDIESSITPFKIKNNGGLNFGNIPTSSSGLSSGDVWNNSGVLNIVP